LLLLSLPALGVGLSAAAPVPQRIKIGTIVPEGSIWDKAVRRMGAEWKSETDGRVSISVYPGGVAGDEPDLIRKMRIGQLQGAVLSASGLGDIEPAFRIFETPMFFRSDGEIRYIVEKMGPEFERRLGEQGYVLIHWGDAGWLRIFSTKPIDTYADFEKMKHFVWGSENRMGIWYQEKGLKPVPLAATDVLTGLQTGLIDALPATPLTALSLQWFRSAPNMFDHRFAPLMGATIVSKRGWKKVKEADRELLLASGRKTSEFLFEEMPIREEQALAEMQRRGLVLTHAADSDRAEWESLAAHLQKRMREVTVPQDIFDQASALLEEYRQADRQASRQVNGEASD